MIARAIEIALGRSVNFDTEVKLQDDGNGAYIKEWNAPEAQPTQAEIEAAYMAVSREAKKATLNAAANNAVNQLAYPIEKQLHYIARTLELERKERKSGPLTTEEQDEIALNESKWASIRTIRANEAALYAQVDSATTQAELDLIQWV